MTVNAVSPGHSRTGFGGELSGTWAVFPKIMKATPLFHSAEEGAEVVVYATAEPTLAAVTGQFFMHNKPRESKPVTHSTEAAQRLWRLSEQLTNLASSPNRAVPGPQVARVATGGDAWEW